MFEILFMNFRVSSLTGRIKPPSTKFYKIRCFSTSTGKAMDHEEVSSPLSGTYPASAALMSTSRTTTKPLPFRVKSRHEAAYSTVPKIFSEILECLYVAPSQKQNYSPISKL